ncbi:MAG: PASTA domain-containing protein [Candidatus Eremiobacteraeota bacterium]|nr:PASTA domain-containing protein [Candidatus Eremiobacteraeota bacterium]MBC5826479.1 PASTA domain-containing protein [Candidatus Eremiobacteraeota bacterium]
MNRTGNRRRSSAQEGALALRPRRHFSHYIPVGLFSLLILALLLVAIAVARWFWPAGPAVVVPRFVGMSYDQADALATAHRLSLKVISRRADYQVPKDEVLGQLPAAGEHVREGRTVDLIVSDGVPSEKVPNVGDVPLREATIALQNARLKVGKVAYLTDPTAVDGTVLTSSPDALAVVPAGTKVDLVIARGGAGARIPDFSGLPLSLAQAAAKGLNLDIKTPPTYQPIAPGSKPYGIVVSQKPSPGQTSQPKHPIELTLSGGAPPTPQPSIATLTPPPSAAPTAAPTSALPAPNAKRSLHVVVSLPSYPTAKRLRIALLDADGARTLYNAITKGGLTLSFDVVVAGSATIETYADNYLVNATPL